MRGVGRNESRAQVGILEREGEAMSDSGDDGRQLDIASIHAKIAERYPIILNRLQEAEKEEEEVVHSSNATITRSTPE